MPARALALLAVAGAAAVAAGCGGADRPATGSTAASAGHPAATPRPLYRRLASAYRELRGAAADWRARPGGANGALPRPLHGGAVYVEHAVGRLAEHPRLAAATLPRLRAPLAGDVRDLIAARRDLRRLSAGWPARRIDTGPPTPIGELLRSYRSAQRRFDVARRYLAAINLVESAFGRVRSRSVAGAQGPMQFLPSSWRAYGLGGDIRDPGDAILAAANLLSQAGAPASYGRALYAYNPSHLYVDAVSRYADVIGRDPAGLYVLYSWPAG